MPITFSDVYAGYRRGCYVLKGVSCTIEPRTIVLGPNGAGKTTMFRVILGLTPVARGVVEIDGRNIDKIYGEPGIVSTNIETVWWLLRLPIVDIARLYIDIVGGDLDKFLSLIEMFKIKHVLRKRLDRLSAGEKRIVLNSLALSLNTKYVLLDEPFENLDPRARARMLELILEHSNRVVMNTHATWLLDKLRGWKAVIMVSGRVFGSIDASILPNLGIVEGHDSKAKLVIEVEGKKLSLVEGAGHPISRMDSLDRLYEVVIT